MEWNDNDGDCIGDNSDPDDDNDGYTDDAEFLSGTNSLSSQSKPVESFEVIVPGTNIGLGGWDLIGILGGVPFFGWIMFCLITRNGRTIRFEEKLYQANTEELLSEISQKYERSLMLRMIGPHQALRLERIRSTLEVKFNQVASDELMTPNFGMNLPSANQNAMAMNMPVQNISSGPEPSMQGRIATDGNEWIKHNGSDYYRRAYSGGDWTKWN